MTVFKILYIKGKKSFIRQCVQNLFLSVLSKLFPKNFENYKLKIKNNIIKKLALLKLFIYRKLKSFHLKLKYPKYLSLPARHIIALEALIKFLKVFEGKKINFFLVGGTLLGAEKHESFAGRPTDVDLGIKEDELPELLSMLPTLEKMQTEYIKTWPVNGCERVQMFFCDAIIDVGIYRKKKIGKDLFWIGETEQPWDQEYDGITFPLNDLDNLATTKLYGKIFLAPSNAKNYLLKKFGINWTAIYKNQFLWKK